MKRRNQWCTLSIGGYIAAAKIRNHTDAGALGEQRGVANLDREAASWLMANGLAMAANGADSGCLQAFALQQVGDRLGGQFCPAVLRQGGTRQFVIARGA